MSITLSDISDDIVKKDVAQIELLVSHLKTGSMINDNSIYCASSQGAYIVNSIINIYTKIITKVISQLPIGGSLVNVANALYKPSSLFLETTKISNIKNYINKEIYLKEIANIIVNYINDKNKEVVNESFCCIDDYKNTYKVSRSGNITVITKNNEESYISFPYVISTDMKFDMLFIGKEVAFMIFYKKNTSEFTIFGGRLIYDNFVPKIEWLKYHRTIKSDHIADTIRFVNDGLVISCINTNKLHILTVSNRFAGIDHYICSCSDFKDIKDLVLSRYQATYEEEED